MNNSASHIDPSVITRFLSGEATETEKELLLLWKDASPENQKQFADFQEVWLLMDKTSSNQNIDIEAEWEHLQNTIAPSQNTKTRSIFLHPLLRIAASVLILVGISIAGWMYFSKKTVESPLAETREITLPDGSRVTLNAGSKLEYSKTNWDKNRTVTLLGEGFFQVTKNPEAPFEVKIDGASIRVLGTSFNVKSSDRTGKIEVTVQEGTVRVYEQLRESNQVTITRGESAIFDKQKKNIEKLSNSKVNALAWKTRIMVFENDSLSNVIELLSEVYHCDIQIGSAEMNRCTITTVFDNKDLITVLKVLKSTLDITIEEKDGKIIIKGKGC